MTNMTMQSLAPAASRLALPSGRRSRRLRRTALMASLVVTLGGLSACGSGDEDYDFDASRQAFQTEQAERAAAANAPVALFNPRAAQLPFPNDLLFGPDGTLNVPVALDATTGEPLEPADPAIALNQLDGFSTVAPISASVSEALDNDTVTLGETVRVFEVQATPQGAVTSLVRELDGTELAVRSVGTTLAIVPLRPLAPSTRYLAVLTDGIRGEDEQALTGSLFYGLAKNTEPYTMGLAEFEPVRQLTQSHLGAAGSQGIDAANIVLSWTFKTQSTREPIQAAADIVTPTRLLLAPAPGPSDGRLSTSDVSDRFQGKADVWIGTLDLPYYQVAASADDATTFGAAVDSFWRNAAEAPVNPADWTPVLTTTVTVPVLMTVPNAASNSAGQAPGGGWPVTVFQHGITGNRTNMLPIADAMADAGRVVIAIDLPMHGIVDVASELNANNTPFAETERHFGIDLNNADPTLRVPDGVIDDSGDHFYTLTNLANSRDNLRQATADLLTLSASLPNAVVSDGMGGAVPAADAGLSLNAGEKNLIGHSLGGIVGTTTLSYDSSYLSASLASPGGGLPNLLAGSEVFGPDIRNGLAAAGIVEGTPDYARYFVVAQTVLDSGDAINHAPVLAADASTGVHLIQVDGDLTLPNEVEGAPLSGTLPLARVLQVPQVDQNAAGNRAFVRFSAGNHSTLLGRGAEEGGAALAATVEMQRQVAGFAASLGQVLPINDTSVITPVSDQ